MQRLRLSSLVSLVALAAASCGSAVAVGEADPTATTQTSTTQTSTEQSTTVAETGSDGLETGSVEIIGEPLPQLTDGGVFDNVADDPAIGTTAPTLEGSNFNGIEVAIGPDGRAKVVYFLAHWCPHCQDEVELINEIVADGSLPPEVDLYAVTIAVDPGRPNYPPSAWLEKFPGTVLRDNEASEAGIASGVSGIPYALYLDGDNQLVARSVGGVDKARIVELWESLVP